MTRFPCPYLQADVELTDERKLHIATHHPDLLPEHWDRIADVLAAPDQVRLISRYSNARLFSRWFPDVRNGKHVVVVVVLDNDPAGRKWIVTAYLARKLAGGVVEWQRN